MVKKKVSRKVKRRLTFIGPIFIGIFVVFSITIFSYIYKIDQLSTEKQILQNNLEKLTNEEESLTTEIEKLRDPDYIAKYARENYFYTKDGEYVIKIKDKTDDNEIIISRKSEILYAVITVFVLLGTFLIIYIKKKTSKDA